MGDGRGQLIVTLIVAALVAAAGGFGVVTVTERMAANEKAAATRALTERAAALDRSALAGGSALACLDAGAGETVENACERQVFATPQSAAAAVAYLAARIALLQDAAALHDKSVTAALAESRRTVELDRFGLAAQVLAARAGCTVEHCAAFALVDDANALKSNMKAQAYEQYVSRYAAAWNAAPERTPVAAEAPPALAAAPAAPLPATVAAPFASANEAGTLPLKPVDKKWDFPSAASIPPVSIMNAEPPLKKAEAEQLNATQGNAAPAAGDAAPAAAANPPLPPKRPPVSAVPEPAR